MGILKLSNATNRALVRCLRYPQRHRVGEHLAHGVFVQAEHSGCLPDAHPLCQAGLAHTKIQVHDVHPCHLPVESFETRRKVTSNTVFDHHNQAAEPSTWYIISPPHLLLLSDSIRANC